MQSIRKTVLVTHSAELMKALVDRVEDYPKFLPWCGGVEIHERGDDTLEATVRIDFLRVKSHFRTRNRTQGNEIDMQLVDGPFQHFEGIWRFTPLMEDACKIEFELDYQFQSRTFETLIGPVFGKITGTFVDCFIKEADRRHG
ncbi:Ribosome association toxin PasT (RatA) of the RatAB toxin-antitoxin module [Andreprevotia lacus DSM 23236]|jgi:ribosome-associated toxin RatA of RatAB toxin-antitoxin module|uniref:Ribosome association toxin PasT (RatA) of the RatAB toxin-antitoxin module n=1 Tax=Andreprevotia lacus DSM 23236 TaxID=1121001 RepID=A0A1W1XDV7_9NEIS|nr:type II toxin-antitoxin system RatA family toxin [Andreprevotia lacus]SMC22126.1 Ribosome association toxin PasT (RatA) of the RatAB toxin-antitoxin module [Andreprevotia lacus DSM 23236]